MSLGTLLTLFVVPTMYTLLARKKVPGEISTLASDVVHPHDPVPQTPA